MSQGLAKDAANFNQIIQRDQIRAALKRAITHRSQTELFSHFILCQTTFFSGLF